MLPFYALRLNLPNALLYMDAIQHCDASIITLLDVIYFAFAIDVE